jgi:hypothetical protein
MVISRMRHQDTVCYYFRIFRSDLRMCCSHYVDRKFHIAAPPKKYPNHGKRRPADSIPHILYSYMAKNSKIVGYLPKVLRVKTA